MEVAINNLKSGGIIRLELNTGIYLACNAGNEKAVNELNQYCSKESDKRLLVDKLFLLEKHVPEFNPICYDLIETATKPLTIIYPSFEKLPVSCGLSNGKIAIRVLENQTIQRLTKAIHHPLLLVPDNQEVSSELISVEKSGMKEQLIEIGLHGEVKIIQH